MGKPTQINDGVTPNNDIAKHTGLLEAIKSEGINGLKKASGFTFEQKKVGDTIIVRTNVPVEALEFGQEPANKTLAIVIKNDVGSQNGLGSKIAEFHKAYPRSTDTRLAEDKGIIASTRVPSESAQIFRSILANKGLVEDLTNIRAESKNAFTYTTEVHKNGIVIKLNNSQHTYHYTINQKDGLIDLDIHNGEISLQTTNDGKVKISGPGSNSRDGKIVEIKEAMQEIKGWSKQLQAENHKRSQNPEAHDRAETEKRTKLAEFIEKHGGELSKGRLAEITEIVFGKSRAGIKPSGPGGVGGASPLAVASGIAFSALPQLLGASPANAKELPPELQVPKGPDGFSRALETQFGLSGQALKSIAEIASQAIKPALNTTATPKPEIGAALNPQHQEDAKVAARVMISKLGMGQAESGVATQPVVISKQPAHPQKGMNP